MKDYKRPWDKIHELTKQNMLVQVKRGVFVPGPALQIRQPEPYLLANHLAGPSYVSMETALSHWQLIPEQVYETTSAITGRSKTYETPMGRFSYRHLPLPYYSFGQQSLEIAKDQVVLIGTPEKALCDKIIVTAGLLFRSSAEVMDWLTEDMRIEKDRLHTLQTSKMPEWLKDAPKRESLRLLIKTLEKL